VSALCSSAGEKGVCGGAVCSGVNVITSASMDVIKRDTGRDVDVDCEGRRFSRGNASLLLLRRSMETETASISISIRVS
jgi:hypothetical protein